MPLGKRVAASPTRASRIKGGIYGLLIGDALGVPYEFHPARAIPPANRIEMEPPAGFPRAHAGTPPGTWSDDGTIVFSPNSTPGTTLMRVSSAGGKPEPLGSLGEGEATQRWPQ